MIFQLAIFQLVSSLLGMKINTTHNGDTTRNVQETYNKYDYTKYQPFSKMEKELKRLSKIQHPEFTTKLFSIGETFEERNLWAIEFQSKNKSRKRETIVVDCGAHAREWIAPSTCMYIIFQFSQSFINPSMFSTTPLSTVLKYYNWVIIPAMNPDGYVYTWHNTSTRLWRKNRSYTKKQKKIMNAKQKEICRGVDVNRNFGKAWGGPGAPVNDPCYEMYAGDKPFSEKESKALARYLKSIKQDIQAYVSLHCFGLAWMTPWGFKKEKPKDYKEMILLHELAAVAVAVAIFLETYSLLFLDPNSGNSVDWVYSKLGVIYSYMVEMFPNYKRNIDNADFIQPPNEMVKNAHEIIVGLTALARALAEGE